MLQRGLWHRRVPRKADAARDPRGTSNGEGEGARLSGKCGRDLEGGGIYTAVSSPGDVIFILADPLVTREVLL